MKIRVMHLIHELCLGGAQNGIINLVNNIDPNKFESAVCAFVSGGVLTERVDTSRTKLFELNKQSGNDFRLPLKLYRLFKQWKPHVVHTHSWGTLCEGVIGAKLAKVPVIIHGEHGTIQQKNINKIVQRFFWGIADQVLSVSRKHRNALAETIHFPENKIKVIINGVDTQNFYPNESKQVNRKNLNLDKNAVVIGTVGRLVPVKNYPMLLECFSKLLEQNTDIKLVFVGSGSLADELDLLACRLGISSYVMFLGKRSDVSDILQAMDIFVLSSDSEGLSNTILEAMSCGLPVVATDVGGNPEIIEDGVTGFLVPKGNPRRMVERLSDLMEDKEKRKRMGEKGRQRIERYFSLEKMVVQYEMLYLSSLK